LTRTSTNVAAKSLAMSFELRSTDLITLLEEPVWDPIRLAYAGSHSVAQVKNSLANANIHLFTALALCFSAEIVSKAQHG
jgi:hypothetical protein